MPHPQIMASNMAQDLSRRDGESSQAGTQLYERDNLAHAGNVVKRSPQPAPMPAAAPGPQPTHAPNKRSADEPERLRVRADDFAQRLVKRSDQEEHILGPFFARSEDEVLLIKREITERRRRGELKDRSMGLSNIQNLEKRSTIPDEPGLEARDSTSAEDVAKWELSRRDVYRQIELEKRIDAEIEKRQTAEQERCYVGNDQLSCYPTAGTDLVQGQWSRVSPFHCDISGLIKGTKRQFANQVPPSAVL